MNEKQAFNDYLKGYNIHLKQSLGQNFLYNTNILNQICDDANLMESDHILEIGTGAGTLTDILAQRVKQVYAIEIDWNLKRMLEHRFEKQENVNLIFEDALHVNFSNFDFSPEQHLVVANIPYYIMTDIILKIITELPLARGYHLLIQEDAMDRIIPKYKSKSYGPLAIFCTTFCKTKKGKVLSAENFIPRPNVSSALIHMENRMDAVIPIDERKAFYKFLKQSFSQRRKTLVNNLKNMIHMYPNIEKIGMPAIFNDLDLELTARPESLTVEKWQSLYLLLH